MKKLWTILAVALLWAATSASAQIIVTPNPLQGSTTSQLLGGVGNAAIAYVSASSVQLVDKDDQAVPSATNPVWVDISGTAMKVTTATTADLSTCLDTGAEAVGTNYYVFLTRDSGTPVLKCSASKTAPTGLTTKRLVGAFHNGPSSDILPNSVWSLARGERDKEGMVKVGSIWVDIYELSVWDSATYGAGTQKGSVVAGDNYSCADTGNDCAVLYGQSRYGVIPSTYMSWFQAQRFCANAGKRLITNDEWQTQALGTPEVATKTISALTSVGTTATATITTHGYGAAGATRAVIIAGATQAEYNGAYTVTVSDPNTVTYTFAGSVTTPATGSPTAQNRTDCIVNAPTAFGTGTATACKSWANTYDNVGNAYEWAGQWFAGTLASASPASETPGGAASWAPGLVDYAWNVRGAAYADGNGSAWKDGIPAAPVRGGVWSSGTGAGVFALNLNYSPWYVSSYFGGRCAGQ